MHPFRYVSFVLVSAMLVAILHFRPLVHPQQQRLVSVADTFCLANSVGFQPCGLAELITRIAAGHNMRHTSGCNQQVRSLCARKQTRLTNVAASTCEGIRCFLRHAQSTLRRARKAHRRATRRLRFRKMKLPLSSCRFCASSFL